VPRQVLDPNNPVSIGAMVGPEAFTEVKYMAHMKNQLALDVIPKVAKDFQEVFGRSSGGLVRGYKLDGADTVVIALGSILGTIKDVVDEMVAADIAIGVLGIIAFRPFPTEAVRAALSHAKRVIVLEKAFQVGIGGIVIENVRTSLRGSSIKDYTVIAGLGGRPITKDSLRTYLDRACVDGVEELTFLDLDQELADSEILREVW
jgi:pyruvate ferredoxin oxidoreductase alpha subunit